jgi:hypothetical protein
VDSLEKVIEKLATTEKTTIAIAREEGGKIRVTSGSWDGEKVILKGQVLEVRNVDGRLYVARKAKKPDEWDPPIAAYDPYGPGTGVSDHDIFAGRQHSFRLHVVCNLERPREHGLGLRWIDFC